MAHFTFFLIDDSMLILVSNSDFSLYHYLRSDVKLLKMSCEIKTNMGDQTKHRRFNVKQGNIHLVPISCTFWA